MGPAFVISINKFKKLVVREMNLKDFFKHIKIFSGIGEKAFSDLLANATEFKVTKSEFIFMEGDASHNVYFVMKGLVGIMRTSEEGKDTILEILFPGDIFGAVAAMRGEPYPASAQALSDCVIMKISRNIFNQFIQKNPHLYSQIMKVIGERVKSAHELIAAISTESAQKRIARIILKLIEKIYEKKGDRFVLHFTRKDIAEMAGVTLETAIRLIKKMEKNGIVLCGRGFIEVISPEGLNRILEGS